MASLRWSTLFETASTALLPFLTNCSIQLFNSLRSREIRRISNKKQEKRGKGLTSSNIGGLLGLRSPLG